MPRHFRTEAGLETGMFSVHQMHPEAALRLALSVTLAGLGKQGRSVQTMITEYGTALVIVSADVDYLGELTFFPESSVIAEAAVSLREDGRLVTFRVRVAGRDTPAIGVRIGLRPIRLTGGPALDALPGPLPPSFGRCSIPTRSSPRTPCPRARCRRTSAGTSPTPTRSSAPSVRCSSDDRIASSPTNGWPHACRRWSPPHATSCCSRARPNSPNARSGRSPRSGRSSSGRCTSATAAGSTSPRTAREARSSSLTTFAPNRSPAPKGRCARSRSKPSGS